jgi:hypothetical protein
VRSGEARGWAQTTADYINYNLEHGAFEMAELRQFMLGLVAGGPTKSSGGGGEDAGARTQHPSMVAARSRVLAATRAAKIAFLNSCNESNVVDMIKEGVMICTGGDGPAAAKGREFTKRPQPW